MTTRYGFIRNEKKDTLSGSLMRTYQHISGMNITFVPKSGFSKSLRPFSFRTARFIQNFTKAVKTRKGVNRLPFLRAPRIIWSIASSHEMKMVTEGCWVD